MTANTTDTELGFCKETPATDPERTEPLWKILIVDGDEEVHRSTRRVLKDFAFEGIGIQLDSAYSGDEARALLNDDPTIALILLNVMMEDEYTGLNLVKYIRTDLKDKWIQIILRTDQPEILCKTDSLLEYEINDYRSTAELTAQRLIATVASSLRAYSLTKQLKQVNYKLLEANREIEHQVRQRTEEFLEAKEAAEYNLRQRSDMLAHITHDLRSPLGGILGLSQMLAMGGEPDEQEEICATISESCEHLLELVNNVLDFSKIDSGEFTIAKVRFNLRDSVNAVRQLMTPLATQKGLSLEVDYADSLPTIVDCDPTRLKQILQNLVGNAIKFTEVGDVRIKVQFESSKRQRTLVLHVTDTGTGIAPNDQKAIFERYKQVEGAQEEARPGSGLGLFITKHLINIMGGTMNLHSEVNKGTTFAIRLPIEAAIDTEVEADTGVDLERDGVSINIMDTGTADILRRKLISWGFTIKDNAGGFMPDEPAISRTVAIFDQASFKRILNSSMASELNNYLGIIWVRTARLPESMLDQLTIPVKVLLLPLRTFAIADACDELLGSVHKKELSQNEYSSIWPSLKLKLVIVEENQADLQLLQIFLQKLKCKMKIIDNLDELAHLPNPEQYNAVLMSCTTLKQRPAIPGLPIIVFAEDGAMDDDYSQFSTMVEGVLEKPVQPSRLIPILDHFITMNQLSKTQTFSIH